MPQMTEQASTRNRGLLIGMAAVVGLSLIAGVAYLPSAFRELVHTRTFRIVGESMVPALYVDDYVTADTGYYADHPIADGDIIVFRHNGTVLVKRVLAVGGETIEGRDGKLFRNGTILSEPYLKTHDEPSVQEEATFAPRLISQDEIFVAGDWRSRSLDSREAAYTPVGRSDVVGKVIYVYLSNHPGQQGRKF
jgi:signal peptidase I